MVSAFGSPAPILRVANLASSLGYDTEALGFRQPWVWIGVGDLGSLHEELVARGARIRFPLTNYDWALEMQVQDQDGNVLWIGSDSKDGVPYGEFLDAAGVRWPMAAPDGEFP